MKKKQFFLPIILCTILIYARNYDVVLESPLLKVADGSLIGADYIEFMRRFRRTLLELMLGQAMSNGERKGGGVRDQAQKEQELKAAHLTQAISQQLTELDEQLTQAKAFFILSSQEFIQSGKGAKSILVILIQEFCQKRNRNNSLLLEWAKTKEGHEATMFEQRITSFTEYYDFCTDLANFLLDLIHSCPKAEMQFKERIEKWSIIKQMLPVVVKKAHIKVEAFNEIEFIKYLKERYLDKIAIDEIAPQMLVPLLTEYIKHTTHG
jgi:hypothetical protein